MYLLAKVERYIRAHRLLCHGNRVLIAVSGGADSVALLHLLAGLRSSWRLELGVAHLDHGLRGAESEQDAEFVGQLARSLNLAFWTERVDVREGAEKKRLNLEEAGRRARRRFLTSAAREFAADRVALGHHRDDQAETVLHHLIRGSGMRGLGGMPPCRSGFWIRPLLEVTREEILGFLEERELTYRVDSSNQDLRFTRNRIRHELLPYLKQSFNPRIVCSLEQVSRLAREDEDYLQLQSRQAGQRLGPHHPGAITWKVRDMAALPPAIRRRIIFDALERSVPSADGITLGHVSRIMDLLAEGRSGKTILLPGGWEARRRFEQLILSEREEPEGGHWSLDLNIPGKVVSPDGLWSMEATAGDSLLRDPIVSGMVSVVLPMVSGSLNLGPWLPGDTYCIRHRRTVKRLWNDAKVPLELRRRLPLVRQGSQVLWIPGFPPAGFQADNLQCTRSSSLQLTFQPHPESAISEWLFRDRKLDSCSTSR